MEITSNMRAPRLTEHLNAVYIIHDIATTGGQERAAYEHILKTMHSVEWTVISFTLPTQLQSNVKWHRIPRPHGPFLIRFIWFLLATTVVPLAPSAVIITCGALTLKRADVALVHYWHSEARKKFKTSMRQGDALHRRLASMLTQTVSLLAERLVYNRPGIVLSPVSVEMSDTLRRVYKRAVVVPITNGVTPFTPKHRHQNAPDSPMNVLFAGGDWIRKGLEQAIAAASIAQKTAPLCFRVVGQGDPSLIRRWSSKYDIKIDYTGPTHSMGPQYEWADVLILLSAYETFSLVAHEAATAYTALVVTDVYGAGALARAGAGLVTLADPPEAAAALTKLLRSRTLVENMQNRGVELTLDTTWDRSASQLLGNIRKIDHRRRGTTMTPYNH